jgi:maleylpyruvate isomerase
VTGRHDLALTLPRLRQGTEHLLALAGPLGDDLAGPSGLPGWSRAHLIGHVARNAEALTRLATWARTGVETPMYPSPDARAAEIEASASLPADVLHADLGKSADALDAALATLTPEQWRAPVRSALGRTIPAAEVPWMRIREVWLHAVDLGTGGRFDDIPGDVVDLLLDDVVGMIGGKDGCPAVALRASDRDTGWRLGDPAAAPVEVTGTAADLAAWLTGRAAPEGRPPLPRWL